jgi:predicted nucleotidyltransferase
MTTMSSQSTTNFSHNSSLAALFHNEPLVDVLSLFFMNPDREFYQRQIAQQTQNSLLQVQRALKRIEQSGLISKNESGNRVYYRSNRHHPAFEDLRRVFQKSVGIGGILQEALVTIRPKIEFAFVFGSIAKGTESSESDIDIFIVGDVKTKEVVKVLKPTTNLLNRELNPVVYQTKDFQDILSRGINLNHFIVSVFEEDKIWLIGEENDIEKVAYRR